MLNSLKTGGAFVIKPSKTRSGRFLVSFSKYDGGSPKTGSFGSIRMSQRKVLRSTTKSKSSTSNSTKNKSGTGAPRLGMHQATPPFLGSRHYLYGKRKPDKKMFGITRTKFVKQGN